MSATDHETPPEALPEDDDAPGGPVLMVIAAVVVLAVLMVIWSGLLLDRDREALGWVPPPDPEPAPRLIGFLEQTLVLEDRYGIRLNRAQREALATYGWEDEEAGLARIPIERAMDLMVEGVLPLAPPAVEEDLDQVEPDILEEVDPDEDPPPDRRPPEEGTP